MSKNKSLNSKVETLTFEEDMSMDLVCNIIIDKILSDRKENIFDKAKMYEKGHKIVKGSRR